jgi:hexosaminidase
LRPSFLYAGAPPAGQLRIASANTTTFTSKLLGAIADMFPGQYFSTGGDEINQLCYITDQPTREDLVRTGRTLDQALNVFTKTTHEALNAKGKTPVVWEGLSYDFHILSF